MKPAAVLVLRVAALTLALFACFAVAGASLRMQQEPGPPGDAARAGLALLVVCFVNSAVMAWVILRSRWRGGRLMLAIALVYYGVTTFMAQIESAVFITRLPPGMLPRLFLMGGMIAIPFGVVAVLVMGKRSADASDRGANTRLIMPPGAWVRKVGLLAATYVVLYFTFGYFIAWRTPAVLAYYSGIDEGSVLAHMRAVVRDMPWLIPFQVLRALLWIALALPVIRMMKGGRGETALAVAALFGIVMNTQLLLPNPYMPEAVRMAHLVETASSNWLFGMLTGWLLTARD